MRPGRGGNGGGGGDGDSDDAHLLQEASKQFSFVRRLSEVFSRAGCVSAEACTHVAAVARILGKSFRESRNASLFHAQGRQSAPLLDWN